MPPEQARSQTFFRGGGNFFSIRKGSPLVLLRSVLVFACFLLLFSGLFCVSAVLDLHKYVNLVMLEAPEAKCVVMRHSTVLVSKIILIIIVWSGFS